MTKSIRLSVITVTYNAEQVLEPTLKSIFAQDYDDIESIVIDGGSSDGTVNILKKYDAQIACWVSEPDQGLYDAMNKGLKKATGDYVCFINAGDILYSSTTVSRMMEEIRKNNLPDVIYGETAMIDGVGNRLGMRRLKPPKRLSWKSFKWGMLVCHQSFLVKRKIAPFYDTGYRLAADYDWCIRCMHSADRICNSHLIFSGFLEGGVSTARRKEGLKERFRVMCRYYGFGGTVLRHIWFAFRFYFAKWFIGRV